MKKFGIIYKITSPSGKFYIGKTIQPIEERLKQHSRDAKVQESVMVFKGVKNEDDWN